MKRLVALVLALCLLLSACSALVPSEYVRVSEHNASGIVEESGDVLSAHDFESLKDAIRSFVKGRIEHGVIRVKRYSGGNVEDDLAVAAYQVSKEDPYGAYLVDYMTHSCSLIVSYYEIGIDITFRSGAASPENMKYVTGKERVYTLVHQAMERYDDRLVMYWDRDISADLEAEAAAYFAQNSETLIAEPEVRCTTYPEGGVPCIVEMTFQYPYDRNTLREMEQAVSDTLHAASVYVRYRDSEFEKASLLFTYLTERFAYVESETRTPIYSYLCDGLMTSQSAAESWQMLCDEIGLECVTVAGLYQGNSHWWNIVCLDGVYSHVDTFRDLLGESVFYTRSDAEMTDYYWDVSQYPVCVHPEPETPNDEETEPSEEEPMPEDPEEFPPEEPGEEPGWGNEENPEL